MAPAGKVSPWVLVVLAAGYIGWGTAQTLSLKWADRLAAPDRFSTVMIPANEANSTTLHTAVQLEFIYSFAHPFTQAFFMFCAETSCLVVFLCMLGYKWLTHRRRRSATDKEDSPVWVKGEDIALPCNPCVWLFPCGADFLASIIQNVGMTLTYASVYQMLRGATVVWIGIISYFWLHRRFTKVELWGMAFVVLGLTFVGLSTILSGRTHSEHGAKNQALGNLLVISAQVLHAYQGVCEERLVRLYKIPPLQMVGTEGLYGIGMTLVLLAGLQLFPSATWGHNLEGIRETVVASRYGGTSAWSAPVGASVMHSNVTWLTAAAVAATPRQKVPYDDIILAFDQMRRSWPCLASILVYIPAGFFYNACQMTIIKHLSAAATVMMGSLRNVTVWAVCLLLPSIYEEHFNVVQFIGFCLLVLGNVLFQRVWITRFDQILPPRVVASCPWLLYDPPPSPPSSSESPVVETAGVDPSGSTSAEEDGAAHSLKDRTMGMAESSGTDYARSSIPQPSGSTSGGGGSGVGSAGARGTHLSPHKATDVTIA